MGDEQDRLRDRLLEPQELVLQAVAHDRVDGAEGLVHEHDRRVRGQGTRHADALALAAAQLGGEPVAISGGVEPDDPEQLVRALALARLGPAEESRDRRDVVADGLVGKEPDLLDDVADRAAQIRQIAGPGIDTVDEDPAGGRLDQAVDHLERRGLAAARRPDQHADLPGWDRQRKVVDGARRVLDARVVALRHVIELDVGRVMVRAGHRDALLREWCGHGNRCAVPLCGSSAGDAPSRFVGDTAAVHITAIRIDRLRVPLEPPFAAAWDPNRGARSR